MPEATLLGACCCRSVAVFAAVSFMHVCRRFICLMLLFDAIADVLPPRLSATRDIPHAYAASSRSLSFSAAALSFYGHILPRAEEDIYAVAAVDGARDNRMLFIHARTIA